MKRVVLDSTVLVSAFLVRGGISGNILELIHLHGHLMFHCDDILKETAKVLLTYPHIRRRYSYPDEIVRSYLLGLEAVTQPVIPKTVSVCRDPNDDVIIGCALAANADVIITRDKDLLVIKMYKGIVIIRPEEAITLLRGD
ncbi:putative toxin-antitoxin system toxin component, PIN family [Candidatus Uhrbacteria bacterium]|nr:putative toxin-antitoxin system toxin component, PIN family [Candidatus Uhrbacteria bacterium]